MIILIFVFQERHAGWNMKDGLDNVRPKQGGHQFLYFGKYLIRNDDGLTEGIEKDLKGGILWTGVSECITSKLVKAISYFIA